MRIDIACLPVTESQEEEESLLCESYEELTSPRVVGSVAGAGTSLPLPLPLPRPLERLRQLP